VGHVGGDDFFIGFRETAREVALAEVREVVEKFRSDVESLYPAEVRRNGYINGISREGKRQKFPLLSISGAVLEKSADKIMPSMDMFSSLIAEAKKQAKQSEERIVEVEI
jgi:GGDEF domain-containing protein